MLTGSFEHTIDGKNRLSIPSKWREYLEEDGKGLFITRGLEQCLFIFSARQFKETVQNIRKHPFTNRNARYFLRILCHDSSQPLEFDKQGRILIPQSLKDLAGLKKDVVLVGVVDRIEVWDPAIWKEFYDQEEGSFEEVAENIHSTDFES